MLQCRRCDTYDFTAIVTSNCHNFQTCYIDYIQIKHNSSLSGPLRHHTGSNSVCCQSSTSITRSRGPVAKDAMLAKASRRSGALGWGRGFPMPPVTRQVLQTACRWPGGRWGSWIQPHMGEFTTTWKVLRKK